jgi:Uma2 family endonuclease
MEPPATTSPGATKSQAPAIKVDRYRFGWRIRPRVTPEGQVVHERIPLTSYDILHPQEGDFRVHNDEHMRICNYLVDVLSAQVAHDPHAVVLHDTRVAWDIPNVDPHGPDIALIFQVRERKGWGTFEVSVEGTRPTLIIEVTSPETRRLDLEDKVEEYAQAGVQYYVIIDAHRSRRQERYQLLAYELTPDGYVDLIPDERGWIWLETIKIWLELHNDTLVCYNSEGQRIGDYVQIVHERDQAQAQAEQARRQAEQAQRQAEQAQQAAEAERQARLAVEEQLTKMEEELRRLRNQA